MARDKSEFETPDTGVTEIQQKNINELVAAGQQITLAQAAVMDSAEVFKAVGRIEAAQFYATVADKLVAETAIQIKQGKKYKGLPYVDQNGNARQVAVFDEFCQVFLGKSARRIQELMSNYADLGPDLYEQAEKLGFRQRDYNALKLLPPEDKQLIAQAMENESLENALDLMQQMAARHYAQKQAAEAKVIDLSATLEAKDKVIAEKTEQLNKKSEQLAALEIKKQQEPPVIPEQRLIDLRSNLQIIAADIKANVMTRLTRAVVDLCEHSDN